MQYISYATSIFDLNVLADAGVKEVIVSCKELSRLQNNSQSELKQICTTAKEMQFKVVLEWDILICENDFNQNVEVFNSIPSELFDVVRVQDPGVLQWILENTTKPVQMILETGNHNLKGLITWRNYIGVRLDRLVLSIELNKDKLASYTKELACPVEILTLGRILLFYTPRKLITSLLDESEKQNFNQSIYKDYLTASGESEESPHKGFPLVENRHGTFMFHIKDLSLLDRVEELNEFGLNFARVDLRFNDIRLIKAITQLKSNQDFQALKAEYGVDVIRGYFNINKSDVLFKKLKNYRIQRKDESYVGEVLEAQKSEYMAIMVKSDTELTKDSQLKFITPEGKEHFCKIHVLKNSSLKDIDKVSKGQLALINYMSGVWTKSQVYLQ